MNLIATIIVGLIAGIVASWIMKAKTGMLVDLILGVVGAIVGGWLTSLLLGVDLTGGLNLTSIIVAIIGAIIVIAVYRFIRRKA
ncbi:MAG TPA: GlsB/YeaQ/YmgE family stress response membrane protein [Anaerolineales bacterium]|nr:GlsB/YeaQ/YmgE family stress response membrane protein [Anaerolineales bacterium]